MFDDDKKSIAVLGGGITGLVAAWRLTTLGHRVRLFEESGRLGGAVRTELVDGWMIESGPNFYLEEKSPSRQLSSELKLESERVEASPEATKRFVVQKGRLVTLPTSPLDYLLSPLLTPGAKCRSLLDLFWTRPRRSEDQSLAHFVRRHFGRQVLDRLAQPLASGICAGDPAKLSTRHAFPPLWSLYDRYGSVLRGTHEDEIRGANPSRRVISYRRGLQTLYHALVLQLPAGVISINARVEVVRPTPPHWAVFWRELRNPEGEPTREGVSAASDLQGEPFDLVVSTLPAVALARLEIAPSRQRPLACLGEIEHPPLSSLFLGYRRDQIEHPLDGLGMLVPSREKRSILGAVFSSSAFPNRAPPGHVALTVLAGGALQPEIARLPTAELVARVQPDLADLLGARGDPVFVRHRYWPRSIPQYNLGHGRHIAAIAACEAAHPGLLFGGQVRDGASLPNAILAGEKLAQRAASRRARDFL